MSIDSTSPKRLLPNNYLFLSGIDRSVDEGIYTCVATNDVPDPETGEPFSVARADIQLIVVRKFIYGFLCFILAFSDTFFSFFMFNCAYF